MLLDSVLPVVQAVSGSKFPRQWHFPLFVHIWRKKKYAFNIFREAINVIFFISITGNIGERFVLQWIYLIWRKALVEFGHYWNLKLLQFCESIQPFVRDNLSYCPWTIDIGIISRYIRTTFNPFCWAPWTKIRIEQLFYLMLSLYPLCFPKFVLHVFQPITIEVWNIVSLPLCPRIPCHHLLLDTSLKSVDQHGCIDF